MAVEYRNRKGELYYLHSAKNKTGKSVYHFSRKLKDSSLDQIPAGYEIYEHPEQGQVFLRRVRPSRICSFERDLVVDAIRKQTGLEHFVVDVQDNCISVYIPDCNGSAVDRVINALAPWTISESRRAAARHDIIVHSRYSPMLRFTLDDSDERLFRLERWCFRSSVDGWYFLAGPATLTTMIGCSVRHLGKESFFELI